MRPQTPSALFCSFLILAVVGCMGRAEAVSETGSKDRAHAATGPPERMAADLEVDGPPPSSLEEHQLRKRFIWTLTQEPYFYGKLDGGDMGASQGSELLPEPLPLRKPTSMHKRLYPRWFQAYAYKPSAFSPMTQSAGERKRFQPFHPMARFRGLSMGGGSSGSRGYHSSFDFPLSDQPGHPVPSGRSPNAQPSPKFTPAAQMIEDEEEEVEEEEEPMRAGELLQYLRSIANDRGISGNTKSFRFGISRRK
ncbi:uncharacterized protein [Macrobrachium rosenbergii]|uniref:uncharacterized protein n=1 Tax=Macrobrachium rosenbergii TaxID=79674 RepID=UPI0034D3BC9B